MVYEQEWKEVVTMVASSNPVTIAEDALVAAYATHDPAKIALAMSNFNSAIADQTSQGTTFVFLPPTVDGGSSQVVSQEEYNKNVAISDAKLQDMQDLSSMSASGKYPNPKDFYTAHLQVLQKYVGRYTLPSFDLALQREIDGVNSQINQLVGGARNVTNISNGLDKTKNVIDVANSVVPVHDLAYYTALMQSDGIVPGIANWVILGGVAAALYFMNKSEGR